MSPESQQDFALAFLSILFEGAPFILLGTLVSGVLDVYLPSGTMDRFLPKNRTLAVLVAGTLGAVFPVCECAVVPVIRRLVKKGLPVSCALTYMLAAPIVNPITALSTWNAFQGQNPAMMTASRLFLGFALAVSVGLCASRLRRESVLKPQCFESLEETPREISEKLQGEGHHGHSCCHGHNHGDGTSLPSCGCGPASSPPVDGRLIAAFRSAMKDFVDVGVYFSIGVVITALFNTGIAPGAVWLNSLAQHAVAAPAALMGLAFVLSLCSTSDAFIAASLDQFSWSAKLAFLTFGPMMDIKLVFLYQTIMRGRVILALAVGLFVTIGAVAVIWQSFSPITP